MLKHLSLTELLTKIYELIREATKVGVMVKAMGIFFNRLSLEGVLWWFRMV